MVSSELGLTLSLCFCLAAPHLRSSRSPTEGSISVSQPCQGHLLTSEQTLRARVSCLTPGRVPRARAITLSRAVPGVQVTCSARTSLELVRVTLQDQKQKKGSFSKKIKIKLPDAGEAKPTDAHPHTFSVNPENPVAQASSILQMKKVTEGQASQKYTAGKWQTQDPNMDSSLQSPRSRVCHTADRRKW